MTLVSVPGRGFTRELYKTQEGNRLCIVWVLGASGRVQNSTRHYSYCKKLINHSVKKSKTATHSKTGNLKKQWMFGPIRPRNTRCAKSNEYMRRQRLESLLGPVPGSDTQIFRTVKLNFCQLALDCWG